MVRNIEPIKDEDGYPIISNEVDVSKVENAVKKVIQIKIKLI